MFRKITDWVAENGVDAVSYIGWVAGVLALIYVIYIIMTHRGYSII
jgi:hypothetical protein